MRVLDKIVILTGAASGIGRTTAILFAKEGAKLILSDIYVKGGEETLQMVKDHRTDAEVANAFGVLDGNLDELIDAEIRKLS